MLMGFEWGFWLLAAVAVLLTGISKSGFAGGVGVVAVPLMALYIDPRQAAAIMLPLLLVMDYFSMRIWWGQQNRFQFKRLIGPAAIGILIGYLIYDWLDAGVIRLLLGLLSIAFAAWGFASGVKLGVARTGNAWLARICGCVTGFTSFMAHAGGPPLNLYLLPLRLPRPEYLATVVMTIACINVIKLVPYALLGQLNLDNIAISLLLMPLAWIGVRYGVRLQAVISDVWFYRLIYSALGLIGLKLLFDSFMG
ncbi:sulfite exporter TauE/SafE family protein [Oceanobacter mangrovi]|uniref:sulfite exporter TauE/SafE family protein n=1 Tax=Oceanobacter mangrovi TaxID=2862510 RepID=UPI001FE79CAE|nr:sulfite exporter TauE/SafE family protein [Oceanobacter mangrovi]